MGDCAWDLRAETREVHEGAEEGEVCEGFQEWTLGKDPEPHSPRSRLRVAWAEVTHECRFHQLFLTKKSMATEMTTARAAARTPHVAIWPKGGCEHVDECTETLMDA